MGVSQILRNRPTIRLGYPKRSKLVIYDRVCSSEFKKLVDKHQPTYLDIRGGEYFLGLLLKTFFKFFALKRRTRALDIYIDEFLKRTNPILVGTNLDIDARFWFISSKHPPLETFFIQHGITDGSIVNSSYSNIGQPCVDYMFVFSEESRLFYKDLCKIEGEIIPIGSMKNNATPGQIDIKNRGKELFIISEWEPGISESERSTVSAILKEIHLYCLVNGLETVILPRYRSSDQEFVSEQTFYQNIPNTKLKVLPKNEDVGNYRSVMGGFGVVFFFSTLGYEVGVRGGIPVACISFRASLENNPNRIFGWPSTIEPDMKGYCSVISRPEIHRVLDDLRHGGMGAENFSRYIVTNPGNIIFQEFLVSKLGTHGL